MTALLDFNDVEPPRSGRSYDIELIARRLRDTAESWVPRLFPNGRHTGDEWRLANIKGAGPRRSGSCVISLKGPHAGDWHDFDGDKGGGPISTIAHVTGLDGSALLAEAAHIAGVTGDAPQSRANGATARKAGSCPGDGAYPVGGAAACWLSCRALPGGPRHLCAERGGSPVPP